MSDRRKLVILWAVAIAAYGVLAAVTDPRLTLPPERQRAVFDDMVHEMAALGCSLDSPTKPQDHLRTVAARNSLTGRQLLVILRQGYRQGWGELPCENVPWPPWGVGPYGPPR
jgi:hypothetical protein